MDESIIYLNIIGIVLLLVLFLLCSFIAYAALISLRGAPVVPASQRKVKEMVALANAMPGDRVIDLGSGDGRIVRAFARSGAIAHGCELNPHLVWWSTIMSRFSGLSHQTQFFRQDLFKIDCSSYQIVVFYAFPNMTNRLEQKLMRELKPGSKIVSLAFPLRNWLETTKQGNIYVYDIKAKNKSQNSNGSIRN